VDDLLDLVSKLTRAGTILSIMQRVIQFHENLVSSFGLLCTLSDMSLNTAVAQFASRIRSILTEF
jgi:hypothetical protein